MKIILNEEERLALINHCAALKPEHSTGDASKEVWKQFIHALTYNFEIVIPPK